MSRLKRASSHLWIMIGALAASFSVACILLPNDAIDYGTAGIAIIINKLTGFNLSICVFAVFLPFLIAGWIFVSKEFFIRALVGSVSYTVGLELFDEIPFVLNTEHFIAVIFGGAILGGGLALILRHGGCIDGSEILANIIVNAFNKKKHRENITMLPILITFNMCVYAAVFVLISQEGALLSLLVYIIAALIIDRLTNHYEAIKQVRIITKSPDKIIDWVTKTLKTTCTLMESEGAISGRNKTVICYVNYFELPQLRESISLLETNAFITVMNVDEIIKYNPEE